MKEHKDKGNEEVKKIDGNPLSLRIFNVIAIIMCLYQLMYVVYPVFSPVEHMAVHLAFSLVLIYLWMYYKSESISKKSLGILLLVLSLVTLGYILANFMRLTEKIGIIDTMDTVIGVLLILVVLDATTRTFGKALPILSVIFILYAKYGNLFPVGFFNHAGYDWPRLIASLTTNFTGVFGTVLNVSATFLCLFMIFGGMLESSGAGKFFVDLAMSLGGRTRSGPAQASLIGSGLVGSINGSATANVATTGVFTIPLMKKSGYEPHLAAAVEAVASTGGMIMPPVMGAGAFIMAGITGIPYGQIALAALIPALLYYLTCGISVHLYSIRSGFKPIEESLIPDLKEVFKEAYFLIPLVALVVFMVRGMSVMRAGFNAIVTLILIVAISNTIKNRRYLLTKDFLNFISKGFISGAKSAMSLGAACACMGLISQSIVVSGLSFKLIYLIKTLSQGYSFLALLLTAFVCILFGMGIPTTASYVIVAVTAAPVLIEAGFSTVASHLFIYYYAILANITPPVASAALVASRMADADYTKTAFKTLQLGLAGFVLPFVFMYQPPLILQGGVSEVIFSVLTAVGAMFAFCSASAGYFFDNMGKGERIIMGVAAVLMIVPEWYSSIMGAVIFFALILRQRKRKEDMKIKEL